MKNRSAVSVLFVAVTIASVIWVNAGSLTPPGGPVAPTMKTLVEVEPRAIVNSLPGGGTYKHGITQPGSYYLTDNIISTLPGEIGILVFADNVTIDLRGFALIGAGGLSGGGVALSGSHTNLAVRNGTVRGWGGYGIDAIGATNSQFEALRVFGNVTGGLRSGDVAIVSGSNAFQNTGDGFSIGTGCTVSNCLAQSNGAAGIRVIGNNSRVDENNTGSNGTGIAVGGTGNLIVRNSARLNSVADFAVAAGNDYGQIISGPGASFVATNPWANFAGCLSGQMTCSGVCVDLQSNTNNCGACGNVCPTAQNATSACVNGQCSLTCNAGFFDCNSNSADGCEVAVLGDANNCGSCGHVCPNGMCSNGVCSGCNPGFADCNANQVDGCEVNLNTSVNNCGACNNVCTGANALMACTGGACSIGSCSAGFGNCNGNVADGCETNLVTNTLNCGTCGHVCTVANGTPGCSAGTCTVASCNTGFANCNANATDGCEVSTAANVNNCGGCGIVCPARANATTTCSGGICGFTCNAGFANCNGNSADGCEVNLNTNINNCGSCGHACTGLGQACVSGACFP